MTFRSYVLTIAVLIAGLCSRVALLQAQPVVTPVNMALGGGGAAYITGFSSNFYNPANLMIHESSTHFQIGLGMLGSSFEPVESRKNALDQFDNYTSYLQPYKRSNTRPSDAQLFNIVDRNFIGDNLKSENNARADLIAFGFHWQQDKKSYSLALRTRMASRVITGRGWYGPSPVKLDSTPVLDRSLDQQYQVFHELSFGYAESFSFLNGLFPHISKLYIGLAPKLIIPGAHLDARYNADYRYSNAQKTYKYSRSIDYFSSGSLTRSTLNYLQNGNAQSSIGLLNTSDLFRPTGYGFGLDFGITYLITLGNDLSVIEAGPSSTVHKSLRISFSITDVGYVNYNQKSLHINSKHPVASVDSLPGMANAVFTGAPGEYPVFLDENTSQNGMLQNPDKISQESYSKLLPTALHTGMLFQVNRIKLMGDLNIGITNNAFNTTKLSAHVGTELRPLKFLPLRAGLRLASQRPMLIGLGTGLDLKNWELSLATQLSTKSNNITYEFVGGAVAAISFKF